MIRLCESDPCNFADVGSRILQEAWSRPCVHYTSAYLEWQLRFPGAFPSIGILAYDEDEPAGIIGAVPRHLRFEACCTPAYLVSFVAVAPDRQGRGIASRLYHAQLAVLRERGLPVVTFALPDSPGERRILKAYPAAGYRLCPLGEYPLYGCVIRSQEQRTSLDVSEAGDSTEFLAATEQCAAGSILWHAPDLAVLEHYRQDPRPRILALCRDKQQALRGAAILLRSEIVTPQGISTVLTLASLFLPSADPEALRAFCQFAVLQWADTAASNSVLVPNTSGMDRNTLRSAGLRLVGDGFRGYLGIADAHVALTRATGTNLEIV